MSTWKNIPQLTLARARAETWWNGLAPREQRMTGIAVLLVLLALVWWIGLAPALRTLRAAPAEHAQLDAQLQQMTKLQTQARALQNQPKANREDALRALESSVKQEFGGQAQLQAAGAGEGATLALRSVPAESLAQWFTQARNNARAVPREVHLTRSTAAPADAKDAKGSNNNDAPRVRWDGTLLMSLPAR